jgi:hypothetical protein
MDFDEFEGTGALSEADKRRWDESCRVVRYILDRQ